MKNMTISARIIIYTSARSSRGGGSETSLWRWLLRLCQSFSWVFRGHKGSHYARALDATGYTHATYYCCSSIVTSLAGRGGGGVKLLGEIYTHVWASVTSDPDGASKASRFLEMRVVCQLLLTREHFQIIELLRYCKNIKKPPIAVIFAHFNYTVITNLFRETQQWTQTSFSLYVYTQNHTSARYNILDGLTANIPP